MKVDVSVSVARPIDEVFDAMADTRNEPSWNSQVSSSTLDTGEPIGQGSRFTTVNRGRSYTAVITTYERPHRLAYEVSNAQLRIVGALDFTESDGATLIKGDFDFRPHGLMTVLLPLMGPAIRKDFPKQFASFKDYCESKG
ncbi:MAG TPA: SRPBCC family protein [Actinomycetes bacterium]|nr:SRPBCC family protein [Actinomycetes bacterium]